MSLNQITNSAAIAEINEKIAGKTGSPAVIDGYVGETYVIKMSAPVSKVMPASAIVKDEAALAALGSAELPVGTVLDVPYYSNSAQFRDSARAPVRRSYETGKLPPGRYKVRVRRKQPKSDSKYIIDQLNWIELNEINTLHIGYKHTALLGVRVRLGDEISSIPSVTCINHGILIPTSTDGKNWKPEPSANPAWIARDIITNRRYGAGMAASRIDMTSWLEWAKWCEEKKLTFNGIFDSSMNLWDALAAVFRAGRASPIIEGTKFSVAIEREEKPVMLFGEGNILAGSYSEQWVPMKDRANEIEIQYYDQDDNYKQKAVRLVDYLRLKDGEQSRSSSMTIYGITQRERAYQEAAIHLAMNRLLRRVVKFKAPIQAIACRVGSVIYVMQDYPAWGSSGKLESHAGNQVKIDRAVTLEGPSKIMLMCDAMRVASGKIQAILGSDMIRVSAAASDLRNSACIVIDGEEFPIAGILTEEEFAPVVSLKKPIENKAVGSDCEVWQTHQIIERDVVSFDGETRVMTLAAPVPETMSKNADWIFGKVDRVKKAYRVKSISGDGYEEREITAIEYNPAVYTPAEIPGLAEVYPDIPRPLTIGHIKDLSAWEESKLADGKVVSKVKVRWSAPNSGMYAAADVYVSKNGGDEENKATVRLATSFELAAAKGDKLKIRVVAIDQTGKRPAGQAPAVEIEVTGAVDTDKPTPPADDNGFGDCLQFTGRDCKITWRHSDETSADEFGSETGGVAKASPTFGGYEVSVFTAASSLLRREITPTNSYTYAYEANFQDTGGRPARYLRFEVRRLDATGAQSSEPLVVKACNPAPRIDLSKVKVGTTFEAANVRYERPEDGDWAGVKMWVSEHKGALAGGLGGMTELEYDLAQKFDPGYYYSAYYHTIKLGNATQLRDEMLAHYKATGWKKGWNPNSYFDVTFYLEKYPDVANSGRDPHQHFVEHGAAEGRVPNRTAQITSDAIGKDALFYSGSELSVNLGPLKPKTKYFLVLAAYDAFSDSDVIRSDEIEFETGVIDADALGDEIIGDSKLLADLRDRIQLITSPEEVIGSVNARIKAAADRANQRIDESSATLREEIGNSKSETLDETIRLIDGLGTATATDIEALRASVGDARSLVAQEQLARANADTALANSIDSVVARVGKAEAGLVEEKNARVADGNAIATALNSMSSRMGAAESAISTESTTRSTQIGTLSTKYDNLAARVTTAESSYSALNTWKTTAQATLDGKAEATTVNQLSSTVNGYSASISSLTTTVNGINAESIVKIDNNGKIAGYGLRSSGTVTKELGFRADTEFIIYADKFAFIPTGGSAKDYPFTIGPVGGVTRTVIKSALIQDAAIGTLKIAGNSVTIPGTSSRSDVITGAAGKPRQSDVVTLYLQMPTAGYVFASLTAGQGFDRWPGSPNGYTTGESDWTLILRVNGVEVARAGGTMPGDSVSVSGSTYCQAGWVTISVDWEGAQSVRLAGRTLFGIGAVR